MTTTQLQAALAAAALRQSLATPGVSPAVLHEALLAGADLALQFSAAAIKFEREELRRHRDAANLPN